jgi:hypothetical protein
MVGSVRSILINRGNMVALRLRETFVKIHNAIKIPILLLYLDSPAEENRQSEKLHSTLNGERAEVTPAPVNAPSPKACLFVGHDLRGLGFPSSIHF